MKIYTKSGDLGETSLWGKAGVKRTPKDSLRVKAYGAVDEANAWIGYVRTLYRLDSALDERLHAVQNRLFGLGADLSNINPERTSRISDDDVTHLEQWIDEMQGELAPLRQFILPYGAPSAAALHIARTVVRRAERHTVALLKEDSTYTVQLKFLNRLSDFLFVAARRANQLAGLSDEPADF